MDVIAIIAERKISEAMARGEFDNLPGRGQPLRLEDDLPGVPAELRLAYKILKNAGFIPPEVELRREIVSLRTLIDTLEDDTELRRRQRELQAKLLKLSIMLKRPVHLDEAGLWQSPLTAGGETGILLPD
jgi:hypothetical protein